MLPFGSQVLSHRVLSMASQVQRTHNPAPLTAREPPQILSFRLSAGMYSAYKRLMPMMLPAGFSALLICCSASRLNPRHRLSLLSQSRSEPLFHPGTGSALGTRIFRAEPERPGSLTGLDDRSNPFCLACFH